MMWGNLEPRVWMDHGFDLSKEVKKKIDYIVFCSAILTWNYVFSKNTVPESKSSKFIQNIVVGPKNHLRKYVHLFLTWAGVGLIIYIGRKKRWLM